MEKSGLLGQERGQRAYFLTYWRGDLLEGALPLYLKAHSYGEYIFDWSWANASERAGIPYYPKLVGYTPFTPSSGEKILLAKDLSESERVEIAKTLIAEALKLESEFKASSLHFLFTNSWEQKLLQAQGLSGRASFQYHWTNANYSHFEDFLTKLKPRKAKAIRKERRALGELCFSWKSGGELNQEDASIFYRGYLNTISSKGAMAYLSEDFFREVFTTMGDKVLVSFAHDKEELLAMALFFKSDDSLYGRYWAPLVECEFLHFELCYYQGIEYAISHKLKRFEAGAQGEHKIPRGFLPTLIHSSHHIANVDLSNAVNHFLDQEALEIQQTIDFLMKSSPYKDQN